MKSRIVHRGTAKQPPFPLASQPDSAASSSRPASHQPPVADDLHARISTRAYELYVQRGCREGCMLEDWMDAERETFSQIIAS